MSGWPTDSPAALGVVVIVSLAALSWAAVARPREFFYVLLALTPTQFIFVPVSNFFLSPADVLAAAASAGLLFRLAARDGRTWSAVGLHLPLGVMIAGYLLGFLALDHFSRTLVRVPMAIVPSILACELLRDRRHFAGATAALIAAGMLDGGYGLFWYARGEWLHPTRFSGLMGVNFSAIVIMTAAAVAFARLGRTGQPLLLLLPVGLVALALATLSKMAFVTLAVTWALVLWHVVTRVNRRLLLAGVVIVAAAALTQTAVRDTLLARARPELQQDGVARSSTYVRLLILRAVWRGIVEHPLVGVGYRNFERHSIREPAIMTSTFGEGYATHNTYLEILVEGGLLVFAPFLLFFWRVVRAVGAIWHRITREHDLIVAAAVVGLPVALLSAASANVLLHYLFWSICGLALSCARAVAAQAGGARTAARSSAVS